MQQCIIYFPKSVTSKPVIIQLENIMDITDDVLNMRWYLFHLPRKMWK